MTGKKNYFISDLHIGINHRTNWFQTTVHKSHIKALLRHIQQESDRVNHVIILGDWLDLWTYPPGETPPTIQDIFASHPDIFTKQGDTGDFITLAEKISGQIHYVSGNHDMLASPNQINAYFSRHTGKGIQYPTVQFHGKTYSGYSEAADQIFAVHGHQFDFFNRCDERENMIYMGLPIGHFITRMVGLLCEEQLAKEDKQNAAMISNSGNPTFSFKLDLLASMNMMELILGKKDLAKTILYTLIEDADKKPSSIDYRMYNNSTVPTKQIIAPFKNLWTFSVENIKALFDTAMENDLTWIAKKIMKDHRIVIMGHTHTPTLIHNTDVIHKRESVYINCGYNCPDIEGMERGKRHMTFAEVEQNEAGTTVTLNRIDHRTHEIIPINSHTLRTKAVQ